MPSAAHSQQQHPPPTQAQMQQQQQAMMHAQESAKRRSRKPTDKNLPDGIEDSIIDPEVARRYKDLRDVERRLDAIITRKRMDAADNQARLSKVKQLFNIQAEVKLTTFTASEDTSHLDQQHRRGPSLAGQ